MNAEHPSDLRGQRGETLIESLLAITILAMVALASYAGLRATLDSSAQHKESAVAETLLRTAAEQLQDPTEPYEPLSGCDGSEPYGALLNYNSLLDKADIRLAEGYGPIRATVKFWNPSATTTTLPDEPPSPPLFIFEPCSATDSGLQEITLSVQTPSHSAERPSEQRLVIVKKAL